GAVSALCAGSPSASWSALSTRLLAIVVWILMAGQGPLQAASWNTLSRAAKAVLLVQGGVLALGMLQLAWSGQPSWPFVGLMHQPTGDLPRFYGLGINQFYAGVWALGWCGLLETLHVLLARGPARFDVSLARGPARFDAGRLRWPRALSSVLA